MLPVLVTTCTRFSLSVCNAVPTINFAHSSLNTIENQPSWLNSLSLSILRNHTRSCRFFANKCGQPSEIVPFPSPSVHLTWDNTKKQFRHRAVSSSQSSRATHSISNFPNLHIGYPANNINLAVLIASLDGGIHSSSPQTCVDCMHSHLKTLVVEFFFPIEPDIRPLRDLRSTAASICR